MRAVLLVLDGAAGQDVQVRTRKRARTSKQDGRGLQSYEVTKVLVYGLGKASIRPFYYLLVCTSSWIHSPARDSRR